ncbi:NAD(P)/FAD-dependent oxidoreductase [Fodinicurvata fenggangensis]|uniref:NAD(P)/FAD-dependent oxidoreductase n=1 Tax=Fodinicurvata fenggangensis TaxID=1121830 RepID=UPI00047EA0B4|nr:NAD(P)/FAD-dependent oxidoreductase [Fodinicurvata fenggangensis]
MSEAPVRTDVAIVGAGPVGLFAIFECGMLKMHCHVIDTLEVPGGQCAALYPEKPIYDIPGFPRVGAAELIEQLLEQAAPFEPVYHMDQRVEKLERNGEWWRLTTSRGSVVEAKAVILAAGVGAFGPNRPPLENLQSYEGQSVFYYVTKPEDFRDRSVVIAGGGDSALDWSILLADIARKVYVVHRRPKFRGAPDSVAKLHALAEAGRIELVVPYQLDRLEGQDGALQAVIVRDFDDAERRLEADRLLPFFGLSMDLGPIRDWGLDLDRQALTVDPFTCETNLPGIHAIGDVASYRNKLKLILSGFSEAATAAHAIHPRVHPDEELHWEYSTTKGVPGKA